MSRPLPSMPREWAIRPAVLEAIVARIEAAESWPMGPAPQHDDEDREHECHEADEHADCTAYGCALADGVARIAVRGVLMSDPSWLDCLFYGAGMGYRGIANAVRAAVADPRVRAIVLDVDSPGGEVAGVHDAAEAILAARAHKPVVAYTSGLMASAAYWLASAATRLVVAPSAIVGSIGTIVCALDYSGAMEKAGVRRIELRSSDTPRKAPDITTDAGVADWQTLLDRLADAFAQAVIRHRGPGAEGLMQRLEGRVFVGSDAVAAGLVDAVASDADGWLIHGGPAPAALFASTESPDEPAGPMDPLPPVPFTTRPGSGRADMEAEALDEKTSRPIADTPATAGTPGAPVPDVVLSPSALADLKARAAEADTLRAQVNDLTAKHNEAQAKLATAQSAAQQNAQAAAEAKAQADAAKAQADALKAAVDEHGKALAAMQERERVAARDAMLDRHQHKRGVITPPTRASWAARADSLGIEAVDAILADIPAASARPVAVVGYGGGAPESDPSAEPKSQQDLARMATAAMERKEFAKFGDAMAAMCAKHPDAARVSGLSRSAEA